MSGSEADEARSLWKFSHGQLKLVLIDIDNRFKPKVLNCNQFTKEIDRINLRPLFIRN